MISKVGNEGCLKPINNVMYKILDMSVHLEMKKLNNSCILRANHRLGMHT